MQSKRRDACLQEHPYQRPPQTTAPSSIKALHAPHFAGPRTRGSLIHLSPCARCKRRASDAAAKLRLALSQAKLAASELDGMLRRLQYQASIPGGVHQLRHCFDDLVAIETATSFKPALSQQAVSPRFLRRLCKLYTSFDVAVDHQIRLLHMRPGVDRTPVLGAAFAADRFRCGAAVLRVTPPALHRSGRAVGSSAHRRRGDRWVRLQGVSGRGAAAKV